MAVLRRSAAALLLLALAGSSLAQMTQSYVQPLLADEPGQYPAVPQPAGYVVQRASEPPEIDGRLDEPQWDGAQWSADFVNISGPPNPPGQRTRIKLLYDDEALYVGAYLNEEQIWVNRTLHDSLIWQEDAFEFFIDPDADSFNYFENEFNANGTTWDLLMLKPYRSGGYGLTSWEMVKPSEPTRPPPFPGPPSWPVPTWSLGQGKAPRASSSTRRGA